MKGLFSKERKRREDAKEKVIGACEVLARETARKWKTNKKNKRKTLSSETYPVLYAAHKMV